MYTVETHHGNFVPTSRQFVIPDWRMKRSTKRLSTAKKWYDRLAKKRVVGGVRLMQGDTVLHIYASPDCAWLLSEATTSEVAA